MDLQKESVVSLSEKEPRWLREKRLVAWNAFAATPAPANLRYGLGIVTPLEGFEPTDAGACAAQVSQANGVSIAAPDEKLFSILPESRHASLHAAFAAPLCITVPDNTVLKQPVVIQATQDSSSFTHLVIDAGKNCSLAILESIKGTGQYHSGGVEIFLGEGSSLLFGSSQKLSPTTSNFSVRSAILQKDARLEWVSIDTGSRLTLSRMRGVMQGQGSSLLTRLMAFGSGAQHFDFGVAAVHKAPDTRSDITQKAALDGQAKMVINGMVKMQQNAPRSAGCQKEDTLLLSPDAEASPIPALEIDNNDVMCSHGTTVGQVDKSMLFYAMSRGLDKEAATRLVVKGFFDPLISSLPLDTLQDDIRRIVEQRLERRSA